MKLKRPKAVYIQIRQPGKPSRNLTVYDAPLDDVCSRVRRALTSEGREKSKTEPAEAAA